MKVLLLPVLLYQDLRRCLLFLEPVKLKTDTAYDNRYEVLKNRNSFADINIKAKR